MTLDLLTADMAVPEFHDRFERIEEVQLIHHFANQDAVLL